MKLRAPHETPDAFSADTQWGPVAARIPCGAAETRIGVSRSKDTPMTISLARRSRRLAVRFTRTERSIVADAERERRPHRGQFPHREQGGPLFVPDVDRVTTQLLALRRELPDVGIHFSTTSLRSPAVIRAVDAFGASFAVASRCEIDTLEREGVTIGRCLHVHPVKTVADITGSYLRGIRTFVVNSVDEIAKFQELPDVAVLVRLAFPAPGAGSGNSSTFGVAPRDARALVGDCLRAGVRVAGFTFQVGTPTARVASWTHAIRRTLTLMHRLEHSYGIRFDTLDLGGGLPVAYRESASGLAGLAGLARDIRAALADAPSRYRIVIETA